MLVKQFCRILKFRCSYSPPTDIESIVEDAVTSNAEVSGNWKEFTISDVKQKFKVCVW